MMVRALQASLLAGILLSYLACTADPLYCDENRRCMDPERPFCDLRGEYPASDGVARTCIPDPNADPGSNNRDGGGDGGGEDGGADVDAGKSSDAGIECQSRLAFQSYRDGNSEIYVSDADGSNQTNLTRNPTADVAPQWSPDGARITFVRDSQVWIMNADGSEPTQLTTGSIDSEPQWSPDGTHIAFIRNDGGDFNLWVVSDSGDEPAQLTTAGASRFSWSPDGTKLAFSTDRNGNADIYTMNSDGSAEAIRTGDSADDERPTWSPDGFEILFQSRRSGNDDLWIVGPLGNDPRNLSNSPHSERSAAFVPDGSKIIYQRGVNPGIQHNLGVFESNLYRMNADGSEQQQLTFEEGEDAAPSVSSDGRRIAWTRNVGPAIDVHVANADGTKSMPLTTTGVDVAPVWQPCP